MFLPYKDTNPTKRFGIITFLLICTNCYIFFSETPLQGLVPLYLSNVNMGSESTGILLTPISYMFIHGNLGHLVFNMLFLWIFGNNVEDRMGRISFFLFYLITGILSGLTFVLMNTGEEVMLVGASGAISAVLAAYLYLFPFAKIHVLFFIFPIKLPAFIFIAFWFVSQISGFLGGTGNTAWVCHLAGFIFGSLLFKLFINDDDKEKASYSTTRE